MQQHVRSIEQGGNQAPPSYERLLCERCAAKSTMTRVAACSGMQLWMLSKIPQLPAATQQLPEVPALMEIQ